MRLLALLGCTFALAVAPATAAVAKGTLAGEAQLSHGCPGPVAANEPTCNPWHPYAGSHIRVARIGSSWATTVVSDAQGRFVLRLAPGSYSVTGVAQARTRPTGTQQVRIRAGLVTRVVVRFLGFPLME
jgi:hypothetical protein